MTTKQAAETSGATVRQLQHWDEAGLLRVRRLPGHRNGIRDYCASDVLAARRLVQISKHGRSLFVVRKLAALRWKSVIVVSRPVVIGDILALPG
jgi:DNA-binding transcriptional MerR regulator